MKWIGQHIYDQISRFRNEVYLEDISASTETDMLVVDSTGKVSKRAIDAITVDVSDFMTNGVDNRVLTATGTDAINAEANLTFDGSTLTLAGDQTITNTVIDQIALDINASNTTGNIIDINAQALTTGKAIYIDCNSLDSLGSALYIDVDDAQTTNSSKILHWIDYDKSSNTPGGIVNSLTGSAVYLNDNATSNHGSSSHVLTGHDSQIGVLNSNGTQVLTGHSSTITNGTVFPIPGGIRSYFSGITDGYGVDFQSISSANTADYFTIDTTTNGATTLTTVDADAALAHFEIAADGNITLDAAGDIALEAGSGVFSCDAAGVNFTGASADRPSVNLANNANDATGPNLFFRNMRDGSGLEDNDVLGTISFAGEDAGGATQNSYGSITGSVIEADHGDEAGQIAITVANDGTERNGITMTADKGTATEVDVTIANGAASVTTIAGYLQVAGGHIIGATDGDIGVRSDNDIILNVDNDNDSSNQFIKFADNGTNYYTFNVAKCITEITGSNPAFTLVSTSDDSHANHFTFQKQRIDSTTQIGEAGDDLGTIHWKGYNDGTPAIKTFATMLGEIADPVTGAEAGNLTLQVASYDGVLTNGLQLLGDTNADGEVDVTIASGAASTTTVAGTLTMGSTAAMTNAGLLSVAGQTNITSLGTLTALDVDNININGKTITVTGDTGDGFTIVTGAGGATTLTTQDQAGATGHFEIEADGNITLDAAGDIVLEAGGNDVTVDTGNFVIESAISHFPILEIKSTNDNGDGGKLMFHKDRASTVVNDDVMGAIGWNGDNDAGEAITYAWIEVSALEVDDTDEAGRMKLQVAESNGSNTSVTTGLLIEGSDNTTDGEVNVTIAAGAASTTTIAGTLTMGSTAALTNAGLLAVANQSNITGLGTIGTGVWNGTAIASAYLDADTAHLTTAQTFTGSKTMGTDVKLNFRDANAYIYSPTANDLEIVATDIVLDAATSITLEQDTTVAGKLTCASRTLALSSSTDGDHNGDVVYFGGTTSMTIGKIYHYKSDGTWEIANADAVGTSDGLLGVALGAASDTNGMLLRGMVTLDHDPGAIGDVLYVQSDNAGVPGNATATPPAVSGDCVRIIGYQVSHASNGNIWFNPDNTFVEVA
tara:strand:- start:475 stop:3831 length:3357 start_codon:yes stop_codon:yes gene_type:complete